MIRIITARRLALVHARASYWERETRDALLRLTHIQSGAAEAEIEQLRGRLALLAREDRGQLLLDLADQVDALQRATEYADIPIGITPEDWACALAYALALRDAATADAATPEYVEPTATPDTSTGQAAAWHWLMPRRVRS